jgi:AcrR family transcriptional regulator
MYQRKRILGQRMKKSASPHVPSTLENALCSRIIGAAFEAFMAKGYANTSMHEIATRAKVSKRDLYANFPTKQALLLRSISNRAARMRLAPDLRVPGTRQEFASTLATFGATVIREVCQPAVMAVYRLAISEAVRSPDVAEILNLNRSVNRDALAALLARAQAIGLLGQGDPQQMMEQFFGLLWGDLMLSRLLDAVNVPKPAEIGQRARVAAESFLTLYGKPMHDRVTEASR